ncbi:MAG: hypothetical protein C0490_13690 [Marivirga sp.]|nr:hypothetical protein [Marivirga sp.]
MKSFIAALVLASTVMSAEAQVYAQAESNPSQTKAKSPVIINKPENVAYTISRPPGLRMRNTGRMLTIIGGAMLIGGIIVYNNADSDYYNSYTNSNGTYTEGDPQAALGVLMIAGGVGMTVPGIIFWSKGAKKYKRHLEREAAFNFQGRGISLSYRF